MMHKKLLLRLIEKFFPDGSTGVEIGVHHAETTLYLLENGDNLRHLYAIDPYIGREPRYQETKEQLSQYPNVTLIRDTSDEAAKSIPDDLDFIFIDGNHSYEAVLSDLENYVPKMKSGGLLSGHDWTCIRPNFGIVQAGGVFLERESKLFQPLFSNDALKNMGLSEFVRGGWSQKEKRHLIHKKRPSNFPLWWVIKY